MEGDHEQDAVEVAEIILNSRLSLINERDRYGSTPLIYAIFTGNIDLVSYLVDKGADVHKPDFNCVLPIWHAVTNDHEKITDFLISRGADVTAKRDDGYTFVPRLCTV